MRQNLLETAPELDSYLATLGKEIAPLPPEERDAAQVELRQHLEALVAAETELGTPPAQAVENALTQFGDARSLGKTIRQTWDERLLPPALQSDLSRFLMLTMFPAQFVSYGFVMLPGGVWGGVALVLGIAGILGWNLGKRHPALGSTAVLMFNWVYLFAVPVLAIWFAFDFSNLLRLWSIGKFPTTFFLVLPMMIFFPSIVAAASAHLCVMVRARRYVAYPWHELRLLPKRLHIMRTRRKDATTSEAMRQLLRW